VGETAGFQPHKLIVPALASAEFSVRELHDLVRSCFGDLDSWTEPMSFTFTHYYDAELGSSICRVLFSVQELTDPAALVRLKCDANRVERDTARADGRRVINLDPGLLSLSRIILASTKASGHRIPIGDGIHAEVTLLFRHGQYRPLEWTYPDFRSPAYQEWLLKVRDIYHGQLRRIDSERAWRL
jgi:hypothetical protein